MSKKYDLLGKRFGKLTVIGRETTQKGTPWICICDCGNKKLVTSNPLITGVVSSCGCLRSEIRIKDLTGQRFGKLIALKRTGDKKNNSQVWECICDCGKTCKVTSSALVKGSTKSCGCILSESRKKALKKAKKIRQDYYIEGTDVYQLCQEPRCNNTSGVVGITYDITTKSWKAKIEFKKKRYYLGSSKDIDEAIKLRKEAEQNLHRNFLDWYENSKNNVD